MPSPFPASDDSFCVSDRAFSRSNAIGCGRRVRLARSSNVLAYTVRGPTPIFPMTGLVRHLSFSLSSCGLNIWALNETSRCRSQETGAKDRCAGSAVEESRRLGGATQGSEEVRNQSDRRRYILLGSRNRVQCRVSGYGSSSDGDRARPATPYGGHLPCR